MDLTSIPNDAQQRRKWKAAFTNASFDRFVALIAQIQRRREWYQASLAGAALAQRTIRTLLWDLIAEDTLLFQAAIFVAGTHSNTCGVSKEEFVGTSIGPALAVLRGASLRALREMALYTPNSSYKTAAVALLAGWERRYGNEDSYNVHIQAWRVLPLPEHALEEDYVLTLLEVTQEAFREELDDQSGVEDPSSASLGSLVRQHDIDLSYVPSGLKSVFGNWPEARSLFVIVCRLAAFDATAPGSVGDIRKLCIDVVAWSPSHTQGWKPVQAYENSVEDVELNILYHIRAACVSLVAMLLRIASDFHQIRWIADIEGALYAHTISCHHLPTEPLIQTRFHGIVLWSRFVICIAARDPETDGLLRRLIIDADIHSCNDMSAFLSKYLWPARDFEERGRQLYEQIM